MTRLQSPEAQSGVILRSLKTSRRDFFNNETCSILLISTLLSPDVAVSFPSAVIFVIDTDK